MTNIYFEKMHSTISNFSKKPEPAKFDMPLWWKSSDYYMKKDETKNLNLRELGTIKSCPAVNDFINYGYILFFPTDIHIDTTKDKIEWINRDLESYDEDLGFSNYTIYHEGESGILGQYKLDGFHKDVLKINTFWGVRTDPGYSVFVTHPQNREDLPFRCFSAIIDTDVFPLRFQYPLIFKKDFCGIIKAGTPMIQVMPFKRENFVSHEVDFDTVELDKQVNSLRIFFTNAYKKLYWHRKKFD